MSHTYASLPQFRDYLRDGGSAGTATTNDALHLSILESASRAVDRYVDRSRFGSGFGPRTGTNRYDIWEYTNALRLDDDLLSVTTLTLLDATAGASLGTPVEGTDYYLRGRAGYESPYRDIVLHGAGTITNLGVGYRVASVEGSFGYQDSRVSQGTMGTVSASVTSATLTGGVAYAGQTLLNGSEQMYVTASTGGTALTVTRGVNGTTAAVHAAASPIGVYQYPAEVVEATLEIAQRRWKARDAGVDATYGGGPIAVQAPTAAGAELSILSRKLAHLKVYHVG